VNGFELIPVPTRVVTLAVPVFVPGATMAVICVSERSAALKTKLGNFLGRNCKGDRLTVAAIFRLE
jgi:hypothetical protein